MRRGRRPPRPRAAAAVCALVLAACGGAAAPTTDGALVPASLLARYLDRAPLPPFDARAGQVDLVACDAQVRPVWRAAVHGHTYLEDVTTAWRDLADEDPGVVVSPPVTFRDGRSHVGLRDAGVRVAATSDRWDPARVVLEVRLPCRDRRPGDPAADAASRPLERPPPDPAFPPEVPPLVVVPDTGAVSPAARDAASGTG